jgi:hypothetical protein
MLNTMSLPRDFSVQCPNCAGRKFYQADQVHDRREAAETTRIAEEIQFGIKRARDRNPAPATPMQPKSRFNTMVSWLLH